MACMAVVRLLLLVSLAAADDATAPSFACRGLACLGQAQSACVGDCAWNSRYGACGASATLIADMMAAQRAAELTEFGTCANLGSDCLSNPRCNQAYGVCSGNGGLPYAAVAGTASPLAHFTLLRKYCTGRPAGLCTGECSLSGYSCQPNAVADAAGRPFAVKEEQCLGTASLAMCNSAADCQWLPWRASPYDPPCYLKPSLAQEAYDCFVPAGTASLRGAVQAKASVNATEVDLRP